MAKKLKKGREEKVKTFRILKIDEIIRSGKYPNTSYLRKKFEVSRSTIMRDIDFLRDRYNAPLEYDEEKRGYYYTDPTFFIKSVMLSEGDLFAVSAVIPLLEQYRNTPLESTMKNIFDTIINLMPEEVSVDSFFLSSDLSFISDPLPQIENGVFYAVFESLKMQRTLAFEYRSLGGNTFRLRRAQPYHVICQKGNWYMLAYCLKHKECRIFAFSRMKNPKTTEKRFERPKDFNPKKYFDSEFGVWNTDSAPLKIELLFDKKIGTYILERSWHPTQQLRHNSDDTVYLSFETNQLQEALHWVMSFGSAVTVLNPAELIEAVKEEVRKTAELY
ncbi:helix-turn-helix transcriptional regulator [Treponema parvum]|uniref:helix-turn-helix transcriptional regulator n=1 Tax=Treponema parvum TaxID=138851 RepID=UPI00211715D9|nr:WYL domain-containing transcriptional regulator [Treponema parvum]